MNILFIIILILAILTFLIGLYNSQIFNRRCFLRSKNKIENYTLTNEDQTDSIEKILNEYNLTKNSINITNIKKRYSYGKGSTDRKLADNIRCVIENAINDINKKYNMLLRFYEIERIEEIIDSIGNKQYLTYIYVDFNKATHYLIVSHTVLSHNRININYIKRVVDSMISNNKAVNELASFYNGDSISRNRYIAKNLYGYNYYNPKKLKSLPNNLDKLSRDKKTVQEPCRYNLHEWDTNGVNRQISLSKGCHIGNNSDRIPSVHLYNNPTVLGLTTEDIVI